MTLTEADNMLNWLTHMSLTEFADWFDTAISDEYQRGYDDGSSSGYSDGWDDGYEEGKNEHDHLHPRNP